MSPEERAEALAAARSRETKAWEAFLAADAEVERILATLDSLRHTAAQATRDRIAIQEEES